MTSDLLPEDADEALLVGRVWSEQAGGPIPVLVLKRLVFDISALASTVSQLFEIPDVAARLSAFRGHELGHVTKVLDPVCWAQKSRGLKLLSPVDLQCIKACGVTFAVSVLERVVEEQAGGDKDAALRIRKSLEESFGARLANIRPGSEEAVQIKQQLLTEGLWSQYLEVAIGPDAEVFTKAPTLSSVGWGDMIGIREDSAWNNPEAEVVLVCNSKAQVVGATLGNDVNLRDFEGRSALLLGKAKDNNASASIGPFIRVFDDSFSMPSVRRAQVSLSVTGEDGFHLHAESSMELMTRDPADLVAQVCGKDHQYPDGFALYLGSLIAPTHDRGEAGKGFTHHPGDIVEIASPQLGCLVNKVTFSSLAPQWSFGLAALMSYLNRRGLAK
jgi:fumarylacetoacetate (FAA) hydrolase family protein